MKVCLTTSALALVLAAFPCSGAGPSFRILIIHSFGRDYAPFHLVASQFRTELAKRSPRPVEFVEASLEMARFDGAERDLPLVEFLRSVFKEDAPDLLVPVGAPAALFCQRHRQELFTEVPSLVVGIDQRRLTEIGGGPRDLAVSVGFDLPQLIGDILMLRPQTRKVFVVMGSAPLEQFWEREMRREWSSRFPDLTFHWLSNQSLEEIRETVGRAPPDSAVFYGILNRDAAGIPHQEESGLLAVRQATAAPVFGYCFEQLGLGVVGGRLVSMKASGTDAARAAAEILGGTPPSAIRVSPRPPTPPTFDWRELRHWKIAESMLPPGSVVLHREPSLWTTHRTTVLVALAAGTAQAILILMLLAARRQARESHASLQLAADSANVGFWRRDTGGDEVQASPKWREIFGLPAHGAIRIPDVLARLHPEDEPRLRRAIEDSAREGKRYEIEHRILLPDGSVRWIESIGRADADKPGHNLRTRGISVDITDRKRIENQVEQQRSHMAHLSRVASLGELSGSLAHELNQPLGSILANAQAARRLLDQHPPDLAELREILADIVDEDRRAAEVIARLKALLKHGQTSRQAVDANQCFEDVLAITGGDLIARGIRVFRDFEHPVPAVMFDRVQLQQVLINLIANACDAMLETPPHQRSLRLRTSVEDNQLHLEVQDHGCGIPGDPEQLFEPFHTTKPDGLGMGLAICKTILEAHQGRIRATNNQDGGATFRVTLPLPPET